MQSYEEVRSRWRQRLEQGTAGYNFDLEKLAPGKFFVLYSDFGSSGNCSSSTELIGCFDNARDFLGYLRHAELPRILDYALGDYRDIPNVSDSYVLDLEPQLKSKIDWLLGLIDRALRSDTISESELSTIFSKFNQAFSETNPQVGVMAWGTVSEVLSSDHFKAAFEEAQEEELDEDRKPATTLRKLLDSGEFDEGNNRCLSLVKKFLAKHVCA